MAENNRILDVISRPSDVQCLTNEELEILANEIREEIISVTSTNGGHIAPSLGAVDLILAVHSEIDVPKDKLIFDVGHQSYAHMLLCGKVDRFKTLREFGGFPGFPRPSVSQYDSNVAGHASDSLSVAAGYALTNRLNNTDSKVVTIIGDAAIEGGMALEALNYIGSKQLKMVIILNDNAMAISASVGAITRHLSNIRATKNYRNARSAMKQRLSERGEFGKRAIDFVSRTKSSLKSMLFPQSMVFEKMGIMCTPPINGNSITEVREMIDLVKDVDGPVLIHAITRKGKGYAPAELDPEGFHGVGKFYVATGKPICRVATKWTDVFGDELVELAKENEDIVAITAAMEGGCGLKKFHREFPDRFIDVGIAEENAVGIASGLAYSGKLPVVCIYSTFLQRAIDQMMIDICLEKKHVIFAIDRAGLVGDDGPTHHGEFDLAYLRMMPNMTVIAPSGEVELQKALKFAVECDGPVAIRYPRGTCPHYAVHHPEFKMGKSREIKPGDDVKILAFGKMTKTAVETSKILEMNGISCGVFDMRFVKPLDKEAIAQASRAQVVVTIEDGILQGGAGEAAVAELSKNCEKMPKVLTFGFDDQFVEHGTCEELFTSLGLHPGSIADQIMNSL